METVPLSVQVSPALRDDVDHLAAALGRDRAWVIDHAVRQYVAAESHVRHAVAQGLADIDRGDDVPWETMKQDLAQLIGADNGGRSLMALATPQVYLLTLLAIHPDGTTMREEAVATTSIVTIQTSHAAAQAVGQHTITTTYPPDAGWFGHQVTVVALPPSLERDGYHMEYTITNADAAHTADQQWDSLLAHSQTTLEAMAAQTRQEDRDGSTEILDPDQL